MRPIEEFLNLVTTPARYLPLELFAWRKPWESARLRVVLAFPDLYEVGMSSLGMHILYHLANQTEGVLCDRVYAPAPDMEARLREKGLPLSSLEAARPLRDFDVVGFSLTHELCVTNVLNILDLAGIPCRADKRAEGRWPLILGGGPLTANPEPLAPFFDAFLFGEGEEALPEMLEAVQAWKEGGGEKSSLLRALAEIDGVYVPSFFQPAYLPDGRLARICPANPERDIVRRRLVADLEHAFSPERPLVPVVEPVHDRVMIEIARGCGHGCRFCQAGIIYRPLRERSLERVLELARRALSATGYEECSLLALSAGDYSCLTPLLTALIREHYRQRVSVSLPSLRVQTLADPMLRAIEAVRKTGFTLAPEAGTERLRRVLNKIYTEEELMETAARLFASGWRHLKLYFMVGLPTETEEDLEGIIRLVRRLAALRGPGGRPQVTVSLSGFVPKAHTPFQWETQAAPEQLQQAVEHIRAKLGRGIKLKWQKASMSGLEGVLSRGDRRLAEVIEKAHALGTRFDAWTDQFEEKKWEEAFAAAGVDPAFYNLRPREREEIFPWEHLVSGVSRKWLWAERERSLRGETTSPCQPGECAHPCGVCKADQRITLAPGGKEPGEFSLQLLPQPEVYFRYRVRYARREEMRFLSQLEITRLFNRAVRRAQLPMRWTQGHHPQPRVMFGPAPPVGVASEAEFVELELNARLEAEEIQSRLQSVMPPGIVILEVSSVPLKAPAISIVITGFDYVVRPTPESGVVFSFGPIEEFLARPSMLIHQKREKGDREVDLRQVVRSLSLGPSGELEMSLKAGAGPSVKPQEVAAEVFGLTEDQVKRLEIMRLRARFKTLQPVRYSGRAERVRRPAMGRRERS